MPFLDSYVRLNANVDGWSFDFGGGWPFCVGPIHDQLNSQVPTGVGPLQSMLDSRLTLLGERRFDMLYLLPGDGVKSGGVTVNVDEHVSLALLPR